MVETRKLLAYGTSGDAGRPNAIGWRREGEMKGTVWLGALAVLAIGCDADSPQPTSDAGAELSTEDQLREALSGRPDAEVLEMAAAISADLDSSELGQLETLDYALIGDRSRRHTPMMPICTAPASSHARTRDNNDCYPCPRTKTLPISSNAQTGFEGSLSCHSSKASEDLSSISKPHISHIVN